MKLARKSARNQQKSVKICKNQQKSGEISQKSSKKSQNYPK